MVLTNRRNPCDKLAKSSGQGGEVLRTNWQNHTSRVLQRVPTKITSKEGDQKSTDVKDTRFWGDLTGDAAVSKTFILGN